jgi:hypothetical protein
MQISNQINFIFLSFPRKIQRNKPEEYLPKLLGAAGRARGGGRWPAALLSPPPPSYLKRAGRRQPRCRVRSPFASAADREDGLRLRFRLHRKSGGRPPPAASHRCIPMWAEGAPVWGKGRSGAGEGRERRRALRWRGWGREWPAWRGVEDGAAGVEVDGEGRKALRPGESGWEEEQGLAFEGCCRLYTMAMRSQPSIKNGRPEIVGLIGLRWAFYPLRFSFSFFILSHHYERTHKNNYHIYTNTFLYSKKILKKQI